jgi:hypothetical protein
VGPQRLDHEDPRALAAGAEPPPGTAHPDRVAGVEDEDHAAHAVASGRLEQRLDQHVDVGGARREVDAGVELVPGVEGQHHDGVGGGEADHDRHHGEQVLGRAGDEGGG